MNIVISGRKVNLKDSFKELVNKKLSKFDKLFDNNAIANVTVTLERNRQTVEVTINQNGMLYRAEVTTEDMQESLDKAVEALSRQFRKHKTKLEKRLRKGVLSDYFPADEDDVNDENYTVVKTKSFPIKPMDVEEAILQMNMIGHQFFMFKNQATDEFNVVYQRKDGKYGLLTPRGN